MRVVTWNMQGGVNAGFVAQVIGQTNADVLCLQETGNLTPFLHGATPVPGFPNSLRGNWPIGHDFFECIFWCNVPWVQGGLAILSNLTVFQSGINLASPAPYIPPIPRNLPWMEVRHPITGAHILVLSIHAPPVFAPVTLANVCSWNNSQITSVNGWAAGTPWVIAGDFNADPTAVGFLPPPLPLPVQLVRGNHATQQGGGLLDYSVTNSPGFAFVQSGVLVGASDHFPQEFNA